MSLFDRILSKKDKKEEEPVEIVVEKVETPAVEVPVEVIEEEVKEVKPFVINPDSNDKPEGVPSFL